MRLDAVQQEDAWNHTDAYGAVDQVEERLLQLRRGLVVARVDVVFEEGQDEACEQQLQVEDEAQPVEPEPEVLEDVVEQLVIVIA